MTRILSFILIAVSLMSSCQNRLSSASKVSVNGVVKKEVFKEIIGLGKVQLVDVRTPEEFLAGHIDKAKNINFNDPNFKQTIAASLKKNKPVAIYCRSGRRSASAFIILKEMGFKEIYDLEGGFLNWQAVPK
ncbi:MAG: rhodanese-like domain-containing protein [Saprospiraceae bacterium]|jgi:rhodanese-related sulfurtransferase|nr:rhodanese-like domain-containing protein [Saprospiraceae bacterium]MDP4700464.1 rhodanese-like domain-containing protein [Saprospiraceae bacterium]MDP4811851.1 rhodanese-like domain-containing protein [Saprospiraceae bacterium]MDP4915594.1 rhodanese-like domain-containing protein [Saprospiraceae bacterium]MDP5047095.1 rhodanese-like domain-containing protein [Saprospiraceae bacterium]